jgi:hypothetical protein
MPWHRSGRRPAILTLCVLWTALLVFQVAISNARIGNADTYHQLVATVHLVDTGDLGVSQSEFESRIAPTAPGEISAEGERTAGWVRSPDGDWFQTHDPGNKVLLAGGVIASRAAGEQPSGQSGPTNTTKVLATAASGAFATLLPIMLFLGLREVMTPRRAMAWAALGLTSTLLLPYAKQTWDVYPAAVLVAGVAWLSLSRLSSPERSAWTSVALFALAALASWFRFSLALFLLSGCVLTEIVAAQRAGRVRSGVTWLRIGRGTASFTLLLTPVFVFNAAATGNLLRPPISTFPENQPLDSFPLTGALGLIASPNRGLLWFCPIFLLAMWLPTAWRSLPGTTRAFSAVWILPLGGYVLAVGSIGNWGAFGWGPRYLVPVIPLLWLPIASVGAELVRRSDASRLVPVLLLGASILIATTATTTNWDAVAALDPSISARGRAYPAQITETVSYIGRTIPFHSDIDGDAGVNTARWPDLAVLYGTRKAGLPDAIGYLVLAALLATAAGLFRVAVGRLPEQRWPKLDLAGDQTARQRRS